MDFEALAAVARPVQQTAVLSAAGVLTTGLLLGIRHGIDWDHIAAITDLAAASGNDATAPGPAQARPPGRRHRRGGHGRHAGHDRHAGHGRQGLVLALCYCIGHGLVLAVFSGLVLLLGVGLPAALDPVFEYVVGLTLVTLGAAVLYQLGRYRGDYRYSGRIRLVVLALRRGWARARRREVPTGLGDVDRRGAFLVGLLHGTGASTPTQVVLFATTAASGSARHAAVVLGAFVAGLVVTDLAIAAAWVSGLVGSRRAPAVQITLGAVTGVASVALGALILAGYSSVVPSLGGR